MRRALIPLLLVFALAGCGESATEDYFGNAAQAEATEAAAVETDAVPVRIGELGASFPACSAAGVTRNLEPGASLPVLAAPFETAKETGRIPSGGRFHVCGSSHDQKWFAVVFDEPGGRNCGVSAPVPSRRSYEGPCSSGWVSSPFVKLVARVEQPQPIDSKAE